MPTCPNLPSWLDLINPFLQMISLAVVGCIMMCISAIVAFSLSSPFIFCMCSISFECYFYHKLYTYHLSLTRIHLGFFSHTQLETDVPSAVVGNWALKFGMWFVDRSRYLKVETIVSMHDVSVLQCVFNYSFLFQL